MFGNHTFPWKRVRNWVLLSLALYISINLIFGAKFFLATLITVGMIWFVGWQFWRSRHTILSWARSDEPLSVWLKKHREEKGHGTNSTPRTTSRGEPITRDQIRGGYSDSTASRIVTDREHNLDSEGDAPVLSTEQQAEWEKIVKNLRSKGV